MTPLYKPINFIPVNSQNYVVHVCQMVTFEIRKTLLSISKVILTTEEVITATLKLSQPLQSCSGHFFSGQDHFVCGQVPLRGGGDDF